MERGSRGWLRPTLAIAVLGALAGALLASPVSAHFEPPHEKKHVKKIARKVARKEAKTIVQTTVGPTLFIEETELTRFGQVKLSVGAADQTVATVGPFTLRASCEDADAGAGVSIRAELELVTSESNSVAETEDDTNTDFDTGEEFIWGGGNFGDAPGDPTNTWSPYTEGHAAAPSGVGIDGRSGIYTNFAGAHCAFHGYVIQTAPQA